MHQAAGIFLGGEHRCLLDPCPALPVPLAPLTLHPQVGGQLCAGCRSMVGCGAGARPRLAPCASPSCGDCCFGGRHGGGGASSGGLPASIQQEDPLGRCVYFGRQSPPSKQTSPGSCREKQKGKTRPGDAVVRTKLTTTKGVLSGFFFFFFCKPLSKSPFEKHSF